MNNSGQWYELFMYYIKFNSALWMIINLPWLYSASLIGAYYILDWFYFQVILGWTPIVDLGKMSLAANIKSIIGGIMVYEQLTTEEIIQKMEDKFIHQDECKIMKKIVVSFFGSYYWKNAPKFRIQNHIREIDNQFQSKKELLVYLRELDYGFLRDIHPYWEIVVIHNYLGKGDTALVPRVDHIYGDGISLLFNFSNLNDDFEGITSKGRSLQPASKMGRIMTALKAMLLVPSLFKTMSQIKDQRFGFREKDVLKKRSIVYASENFELQALRYTSHKLGITINDFMTNALLIGGRRYLDKRQIKTQDEISVSFAMSIHDVKNKKYIPINMANTSLFISNFPFNSIADMKTQGKAQINTVSAKYSEAKNSLLPLVIFYLNRWMCSSMPTLILQSSSRGNVNKIGMMITNLALSPHKLHLNGKELKSIEGFAVATSEMVILTALQIGYADNLSYGLGTDPFNVSDPDDLVLEIKKAAEEMISVFS